MNEPKYLIKHSVKINTSTERIIEETETRSTTNHVKKNLLELIFFYLNKTENFIRCPFQYSEKKIYKYEKCDLYFYYKIINKKVQHTRRTFYFYNKGKNI